MRVLVACEFSGVVRRAFRERGHDAWSCDLLPAEDASPHHYQTDVLTVLDEGWDLMVAHPPCTYLCAMGIWWNAKRPERWVDTALALEFLKSLWAAPVPRVAVENPVGYLSKQWMPPSQIVHPWQFGHEASKTTCLWLRGLPPLWPTSIKPRGEFYTKKNGARMAKWSHKASGTTKDRARIASRTFPGIAAAMAEQWGAP